MYAVGIVRPYYPRVEFIEDRDLALKQQCEGSEVV